MFNWDQFILTAVLGVLSSLKKNPINDPKVTLTLQHIVVDCCEILGVAPPSFS